MLALRPWLLHHLEVPLFSVLTGARLTHDMLHINAIKRHNGRCRSMRPANRVSKADATVRHASKSSNSWLVACACFGERQQALNQQCGT